MIRPLLFIGLAVAGVSCVQREVQAELLYGLTAQGMLISFDSTTPSVVSNIGPVSGASAGQLFLGIDFNAADGFLYGLAVNPFTGASNLYTINNSTGAASIVGSTPFPLSTSVGGRVGIAFDPISGALRVITRNGSNYRLSAATGTVIAQETTLSYAPGQPVSGLPDSVAIAYSNAFTDAVSTTLYSYTYNFDEFVRVGSIGGTPLSPNTGQCFIIGGSHQFPLTSNIGFDISQSGTAYLSANISPSTLFTIDLTTGRVTAIGGIGGNPQLLGLAVSLNGPTPTPTSTPTPVNITGIVTYCPDPALPPVPNVTLTLTGSASDSTLSDSSGNYTFTSVASGGTYTVTPTETALIAGSAGINTFDVIAVQRHFLNLGPPLSGCRLTAADVNGDSAINTFDVIAIQRFFLSLSTGIANVGEYEFNPARRTYMGVVSDQTGQDYDTLIFGDVVSPFAD